MIDGSDSISDGDYELEKTVVKVMAYFFGVMKLGTHNGVVNYGHDATTEIKFLDHETFISFRDAVKPLRKVGGGTRIDRALEEAHDNLFMGGGGARAARSIPKIAVSFHSSIIYTAKNATVVTFLLTSCNKSTSRYQDAFVVDANPLKVVISLVCTIVTTCQNSLRQACG